MRAIIFDFDGTIGDSFKVTVEILHQITHRDQLVSPEEVARLRTLHMLDVAQDLKLPSWQWPFLLARGRGLMAKRLREVHPFPGIEGVLAALNNDGYQLFIISRNSKSNIDRFVVEHGLSNYFFRIYGDVGLLGKSRALRRVLKQNHLLPNEVMYVGDEARDIEAAQQVDVPCVAVSWGFNAPELLVKRAPMVVVNTMQQLQQVLEEWGGEI